MGGNNKSNSSVEPIQVSDEQFGISSSGGLSQLNDNMIALCVSLCTGLCKSNCATSCSTSCSSSCGSTCASSCGTSCSTSCSSACISLCGGAGSDDLVLIESEEDIIL